MTPDGGMSLYLARNIGPTKAAELLMFNETFGATEAEQWHLINKIVEDAALAEESLQWLDRLAAGPTKAFSGIKMLMAKAFEQGLSEQLSFEHVCWQTSIKSFDFREAIKAQALGKTIKFSGA